MKYIVCKKNLKEEFEAYLKSNTNILDSSEQLFEDSDVLENIVTEEFAIPIVIDLKYYTDSKVFPKTELDNRIENGDTKFFGKKYILKIPTIYFTPAGKEFYRAIGQELFSRGDVPFKVKGDMTVVGLDQIIPEHLTILKSDNIEIIEVNATPIKNIIGSVKLVK